jgi:hypothetical protein
MKIIVILLFAASLILMFCPVFYMEDVALPLCFLGMTGVVSMGILLEKFYS